MPASDALPSGACDGAPAIVVLGCRVRLDGEGRTVGALARRLDAAARAYGRTGDARTVVVASGGRRWGGHVEADVMARELMFRGVPAHAVVRERCSLSTRDNARFAAEVLARRGRRAAALVTCAWHMPRAVALFARAGVRVEPTAADPGERASWPQRLWRWGREGMLTWVDTAAPWAAAARREPARAARVDGGGARG